MKLKPKLSIIQGLLFTYCIENTRDVDREELITSINVNHHEELTWLFDKLTKPEFMKTLLDCLSRYNLDIVESRSDAPSANQ